MSTRALPDGNSTPIRWSWARPASARAPLGSVVVELAGTARVGRVPPWRRVGAPGPGSPGAPHAHSGPVSRAGGPRTEARYPDGPGGPVVHRPVIASRP